MTSTAIPSPKEEAMEAAREIVESVGRDGERLKARAALCKFSGYDEDGVIAQYRTYLVARALLSSDDVRREALEEAAKAIEAKHTNNVGMVHPMALDDAKAIRALSQKE